MTQKQKLINAFFENPSSVRFKHLVKILEYYECVVIPAKGSHIKFKHKRMRRDLIIPVHKGECKDFYKQEALNVINEINN